MSRLLYIGFASALVVSLLARSSSATILYGLDVYAGNGTMNWTEIRGSGKSFAFVKATEGTYYEDSQLSNNESKGTAAGVYIGAYDFAQPGEYAPAVEADYYYNYAKQFGAFSAGHLRPVLDFEEGSSTAHVGAASLSAWAVAWCQEIFAKTGVQPIIYTYPSFASGLNSTVTAYPLWIASYDHTDPATNPSVTGPWKGSYAFWQYTGTGRLAGSTTGNVDLDEFMGSRSDLIANFVIGNVNLDVVPEPMVAMPVLVIAGMVLRPRRRFTTSV
ncbi:MAG TPA: glycoside hydrolase family 25 protein [Tepidisphaeraceae bacterium]|nr:glycoside hydrolase family 25 protein [Tepidisphaeraceae bacterium]